MDLSQLISSHSLQPCPSDSSMHVQVLTDVRSSLLLNFTLTVAEHRESSGTHCDEMAPHKQVSADLHGMMSPHATSTLVLFAGHLPHHLVTGDKGCGTTEPVLTSP